MALLIEAGCGRCCVSVVCQSCTEELSGLCITQTRSVSILCASATQSQACSHYRLNPHAADPVYGVHGKGLKAQSQRGDYLIQEPQGLACCLEII